MPLTEQQNYDIVGNLPEAWILSANDLLRSSAAINEIIQSRVERAEAEKVNGHEIEMLKVDMIWTKVMLRAFALECLIKACWLRGGNTLCDQGRRIEMISNERHDLKKMAIHVGIPLNSDEENIMDRMSHISIAPGRYPVQSRADLLTIRHGTNIQAYRPQWSFPTDEECFDKLLQKLWQAAKPPSGFPNPPVNA